MTSLSLRSTGFWFSAVEYSFPLSFLLSDFHCFLHLLFVFPSFRLPCKKNEQFFLEVNTAPIQHTSAGLCNRMWNLVTYLHKPLDAHPVFSFLESARVSPIGWKRKGEQVSSYKKCKQRRKSGYWYYKLGAIKNVCIKWKGVERHTFVCVWDRERLNCETEINRVMKWEEKRSQPSRVVTEREEEELKDREWWSSGRRVIAGKGDY